MPLTASGVSAAGSFATPVTEKDPYQYQVGFGNVFSSEAIPGSLPQGRNTPRRNKYNLYTEGINGAPFVTPRVENIHSMLYRIRPSVAHKGFTKLPDNPDLESCFFPLNPKVHVSPSQLSWRPFEIPADTTKVDFIDGLKTIAGNGDPTLGEGLAIGMYLANTSMGNKAFCNNDGDMLLVPQQGRLDIQTEFGKMMVRPGEIAVVQRGIKWKVIFPDGPSRGYTQELYGSHWQLPDLGPIGSHGLANARDFEHPVASFDIDQSEWHVVYKIAGELHLCVQEHTPFDVIAWHGNYVPFKYDLEKFTYIGSVKQDHIDPSSCCVLTSKSRTPGIPLSEFLIAGERWDVSENTFRPPYYHRNTCTEFLGHIYGSFGSRSQGSEPGGASHETGFCPHGVPYEIFKMATESEPPAMKIFVGSLMFMFETTVTLTITDYAIERSGNMREHDPKTWDGFKGHFMDYLDEANEDLKAAGRKGLGHELQEHKGN